MRRTGRRIETMAENEKRACMRMLLCYGSYLAAVVLLVDGILALAWDKTLVCVVMVAVAYVLSVVGDNIYNGWWLRE